MDSGQNSSLPDFYFRCSPCSFREADSRSSRCPSIVKLCARRVSAKQQVPTSYQAKGAAIFWSAVHNRP
jgi:hypothetical protein